GSPGPSRAYVRGRPSGTALLSLPLPPATGSGTPAFHSRYTHGKSGCLRPRPPPSIASPFPSTAATKASPPTHPPPGRNGSAQTTSPPLRWHWSHQSHTDQSSVSSPPNASGNTGRCEYSSPTLPRTGWAFRVLTATSRPWASSAGACPL